MTRRVLLIDADIVAYQAAAFTEKKFDWGEGSAPVVVSDLEAAIEKANGYIEDVVARLKADKVIVCLTCPDHNFRKDVWSGYKANRKDVVKPEQLAAVKAWMAESFETFLRPALEADDCMGILSTHPTLVSGERIIVSEDKDLQTIPGLLFNPAKDRAVRRITKIAADRYHLTQTVTGDVTDGYPGAIGIGAKSPEVQAIATAKSVTEAWPHVVAAFERSRPIKGIEDPAERRAAAITEATTQARLARILRHTDWDFKSRKPILWTPLV